VWSGHRVTRLRRPKWRAWCSCTGGSRFGAFSAYDLRLPPIRCNAQLTEKTVLGCHYEGCSSDVGRQAGNAGMSSCFQVATFLQLCPATFCIPWIYFSSTMPRPFFSSLLSVPPELLLSTLCSQSLLVFFCLWENCLLSISNHRQNYSFVCFSLTLLIIAGEKTKDSELNNSRHSPNSFLLLISLWIQFLLPPPFLIPCISVHWIVS
jgi:hypothetical protein